MWTLETKIPPPLVAAAVAIGMWLLSVATPANEPPGVFRLVVVGAIALSSAVFVLAAVLVLWRANTTASSSRADRTSTLVTNGVFRLTRNPMYLSLLLLLAAYATYLWSPLALAGPLVFAAYVTKYQIVPEQRVLEAKFGAAYAEYKHRVRMWL